MKRIVFASIFCLWSSFALAQYLAPLGNSGGGSSSISFPATVSGTVNSGGIPYFSSSTGMASSAALTANALVIGGGAGEPPATATTASGVLPALANAPNASGGFMTELTIGTTPTSGGVAGQLMYDDGSKLQEDSGLVWDHTTQQMTLPNGEVGAPSYSFQGSPTEGFFNETKQGGAGHNGPALSSSAGIEYTFDSNFNLNAFYYGTLRGQFVFGAGNGYGLALVPGPNGAVSFRDPYLVSTLPSGAEEGSLAYVTDQLTSCPAAGAPLTGGGSVVCFVFYNGTAWIAL